MRKIDLIDEVHGLEGIETHKKATELVEATFHLMKYGLVTDGTLKISKFGTFIVKNKENQNRPKPTNKRTYHYPFQKSSNVQAKCNIEKHV